MQLRDILAASAALLGIPVAAALLALPVAAPAAAEPLPERPDVAFGQPIDEDVLALWDIDIATPAGGNLPPGQGSVAEGAEVYEAQCMHCHGENAEGGTMYGTMVGGIGSMTERPRVLTPASMYPYAPILFDYTRRAMPLDAPHSLGDDEVYAVTAYIYHLNGLVDEDFVADADSLPGIEMPNRDAFIDDDRPDVDAERCMEDCTPIGTVADADAAVETEDATDAAAATSDEPEEPVGGGTGGQVIMGDEDEAGGVD
jgi:S-disulfanyl-L-cysteine oxidoreductase SoxD